ncbi:Uncharacterised protein [Clostridioides difficile]|uniref:hypothetical protein n=1 Tax=Clostridioides difficile TaxID=1496 RepID=UPI000D1E19AC|nr:hypothetical protein [Clostridioides difficile]EGT2204351.1 hypothetical protein [Clostridioides difficile]EGT4666197.1 hypothetical protein [Clostridioides difficile]UWD41324.1 hypothetical protein NYF05_19070 [Clostridioides difficile]VFC56868.1 Uncharacterised protein [Clostridioides difficile]VFF92988.1 Uncharacterised protein [Clostridioides difficile]
MKIKNIVLIFLCALIITMSPNITAFASELNLSDTMYMDENQDDIANFSAYILNCSCRVSISSGKATVNASVVGKSGVTKTSIITKLQELKSGKWVYVNTSSKKTGGKTCYVSNSYSVVKGRTYRGVAIVTAGNESKTLISTSQKY